MKPNLEFEIAIHVGKDQWQDVFQDINALSARAIESANAQITPRPFAELSLAFLSDADVQALNKQYRGKDKPTNVLSFPGADIDGFTPLLGDIVMAFETVSAEAKTRGLSMEHHLTHLLVHGFYHLQGYDHGTDKDAQIMEALEIKALAALGIANPYDTEDML